MLKSCILDREKNQAWRGNCQLGPALSWEFLALGSARTLLSFVAQKHFCELVKKQLCILLGPAVGAVECWVASFAACCCQFTIAWSVALDTSKTPHTNPQSRHGKSMLESWKTPLISWFLGLIDDWLALCTDVVYTKYQKIFGQKCNVNNNRTPKAEYDRLARKTKPSRSQNNQISQSNEWRRRAIEAFWLLRAFLFPSDPLQEILFHPFFSSTTIKTIIEI